MSLNINFDLFQFIPKELFFVYISTSYSPGEVRLPGVAQVQNLTTPTKLTDNGHRGYSSIHGLILPPEALTSAKVVSYSCL